MDKEGRDNLHLRHRRPRERPGASDDRDILIAGGANTVRQFLEAGLLDELQIHLAPVLLGDGVRLFEGIDPERVELEPTRVIDSPRVTHLRYRVAKP